MKFCLLPNDRLFACLAPLNDPLGVSAADLCLLAEPKLKSAPGVSSVLILGAIEPKEDVAVPGRELEGLPYPLPPPLNWGARETEAPLNWGARDEATEPMEL